MLGKRARPVRGQAERKRTSTLALAPRRSAEPTRLFKQTLGWTRPKIRTLEAADRWSWLIIVAHTPLTPLPAERRFQISGGAAATR
jgi:hypothetical protein